MKTDETSILLQQVRARMKSLGVTLHRVATESGCNYNTLYHVMNPHRRSIGLKGTVRRKVSYHTGKLLEAWINKPPVDNRRSI